MRAVGGLTTTQIAAAFLVPEATIAKRIVRAKQRIRDAGARFELPAQPQRTERLGVVLQVLYLIFNEGYTTSSGPALQRADLTAEAIRLTRLLQHLLPDEAEVAGLLALMLLTDARRAARTNADGPIVPLADQHRDLWDTDAIGEGQAILTRTLGTGPSARTSSRPRSPRCTTRPPPPGPPTGRRSSRSTTSSPPSPPDRSSRSAAPSPSPTSTDPEPGSPCSALSTPTSGWRTPTASKRYASTCSAWPASTGRPRRLTGRRPGAPPACRNAGTSAGWPRSSRPARRAAGAET